ncbi:MAG: ThiF family adenylyltransferase [Paludibaculum sp.]
MKLRIPESRWKPFVDELCSRRDVETAGIILAEHLYGSDVLLARDMIPFPEAGYLVRRIDQLRLDPLTLNRVIRPARDLGLSVLTVHTHPGTDRPWFSAADDRGDARLIPSLLTQMTGPHGSLVVAGNSGIPAGRVWSETGIKADLNTWTVGRTLRNPSGTGMLEHDGPWFDRQRLALGESGQKVLHGLHVVVVGLGGTGSVIFTQLVHLGVGRITVVDGDRVEKSNVSRIVGATVQDAGKTWKVDVAARYAAAVGLGTEVSCLRGHLGRDIPKKNIEGSDLAFSCVDKHFPRALLNRLSYERAMPLIDMGSAFRVDGGRVVAGAGRVVIVGPSRPCLACWGHIDPNRIRTESLSASDRAREIADGYIEGAEVAQPSVVAFNSTVAGAAVVEFLRTVTGFAGTENAPMRLNFDFMKGTVRRNTLPASVGCKICSDAAVALNSTACEADVIASELRA